MGSAAHRTRPAPSHSFCSRRPSQRRPGGGGRRALGQPTSCDGRALERMRRQAGAAQASGSVPSGSVPGGSSSRCPGVPVSRWPGGAALRSWLTAGASNVLDSLCREARYFNGTAARLSQGGHLGGSGLWGWSRPTGVWRGGVGWGACRLRWRRGLITEVGAWERVIRRPRNS